MFHLLDILYRLIEVTLFKFDSYTFTTHFDRLIYFAAYS